MADDIVVRLRNWGRARSGSGDRCEQMHRDAADEIKRLREAGDEMADAATRQQWSRLDVAVAAWQQARRG